MSENIGETLKEAGSDDGESQVEVQDCVFVVLVEEVPQSQVDEEKREDVQPQKLGPGQQKLELNRVTAHQLQLYIYYIKHISSHTPSHAQTPSLLALIQRFVGNHLLMPFLDRHIFIDKIDFSWFFLPIFKLLPSNVVCSFNFPSQYKIQQQNQAPMNKTSYKQHHRKEQHTQGGFFKRPTYSPIRSQKSFDQASIKTELLVNKQYPVTATNWCILDQRSSRFVGVREEQQREVASLTKIMTTIVGLELFQRYQMDKEILIRVSHTAASHPGTSAELKIGKYIRIYDLFYGAMLPSGNDAAYLLAEIFGLLLFYESMKPESKDYSEIESIDISCYDSTNTFINKFLREMNRKAKELGLTKTVFTNPHGLANILNVSSAKDVLTLATYATLNPRFREIMNCEEYKATFLDEDMQKIHSYKIWTNTNKLLSMGWQGIKTGHTQPAGACLASVRDGVFIVVLNSANREARFEDTLMLWEWFQGKEREGSDPQ